MPKMAGGQKIRAPNMNVSVHKLKFSGGQIYFSTAEQVCAHCDKFACTGGMNSMRYQEQVPDGVLNEFYCQVSEEFQQDGAASHRSKSTMKWFRRNGIPLFSHPACSPDLSPIESVWLELKKRLRALPHLPTTVPQLIETVKSIWEELPISDIDKHVDTMNERVKAVLEAKGSHTKF